MRVLFTLALLAVIPCVAFGGIDIIDVAVTGVTDSNEVTATTTRPVGGKILAVHVEVTPTSGTWTNTVTLSTDGDRGVSFADNTILTLTGIQGTTNYLYYPRYVADDNTGTDVVATNGWYVPFYLASDLLRLNATNTSLASTNDVSVRVVIEN